MHTAKQKKKAVIMTGNCTAVVLNNIRGASISSDGRNVEWRKGEDLGGFWGCLGSWGYFASKLLSLSGPPICQPSFPALGKECSLLTVGTGNCDSLQLWLRVLFVLCM